MWRNTDRVFIVNGHIDKADGNYIGPFFFKKISNSGIFLGSYPNFEADIHKLNDAGVNAVLDIQSGIDYRMRGLSTV